MAQLLVRNIDDEVKKRLVARARLAGRSTEEEARRIIAAAVAPKPEEGLGTRIAALFASSGMTDEEHRVFQEALAENRARPSRTVDSGA